MKCLIQCPFPHSREVIFAHLDHLSNEKRRRNPQVLIFFIILPVNAVNEEIAALPYHMVPTVQSVATVEKFP